VTCSSVDIANVIDTVELLVGRDVVVVSSVPTLASATAHPVKAQIAGIRLEDISLSKPAVVIRITAFRRMLTLPHVLVVQVLVVPDVVLIVSVLVCEVLLVRLC
jgi:hypothetical protein